MALDTLWFGGSLTGFFLTKQADGCSQETVRDYERAFRHLDRWATQNKKPDPASLTTADLSAFLAYLRTLPNRYGGTHSPKSVYNAWVALRSFYKWLAAEMGKPNPMLAIPAPKTASAVIEPLSREEVR